MTVLSSNHHQIQRAIISIRKNLLIQWEYWISIDLPDIIAPDGFLKLTHFVFMSQGTGRQLVAEFFKR
ncbi:hypothetical protein NIES3974_05840 [Calothrix sp. NIES-3974]|nr:hypothetical protein NIES3974_05840 [Calothrix sp. NIES-3974]